MLRLVNLRKEHQAASGQSFDFKLSFGDQFEEPYEFDPVPAETEADDLIQRLYSKEPEIKKCAHDDPSVTFKHAEDILANQYKSGKVSRATRTALRHLRSADATSKKIMIACNNSGQSRE